MTLVPQKLTFWKAFRFALYKTNPERLKPYFEPEKDLPYVAKSYEHSFFFIWAGPFFAVFLGWFNGPGLHGGPIPPEVPTFEVTGYITEAARGRQRDYTIHTTEGIDYVVPRADLFATTALNAYIHPEGNTSKPDLIIGGFLLKSGEGTFYPLTIKTVGGISMNEVKPTYDRLLSRQSISWPVVFLTAATGWLIHIAAQLFCAFGFLRRNRKYLEASSLQNH
jgi:hypothetical protein